jgi:penicillin-binding protein 1A
LVVAGVAMLSLVAVAGIAVAIWAAWLFHDMPDASDLADYHPPTATRAYAWDGTLIGEFSKERRIFVPYDNMPPRLVEAFLAAEDRNFFHHAGLDYGGIVRASMKDVINLAEGRRLESGSTITQQVAKNILLTNDATVGRKLKEAMIAQQLEGTLSKERILELYLNEIWLGYRSYGVGVAAYNYFGKPLTDLDLAECAYLASLPKGPDNYHPLRRKKQAMERRNWVLDQMVEAGWATASAAEAAKHEDLLVQPEPTRAKYRDADYFVEEVRRRGLAALGPKLNEGGYYIKTTLDPRLQTIARQALMDGLERYDRRHGWRGAWGHVTTLDGWEQVAKKTATPPERRTWRAAVVTDVKGAVRVRTIDGQVGVLSDEDVAWARHTKGIGSGDLVFVAPDDPKNGERGGSALRLKQIPAVNGALVAMDPDSGRILAMVGGYSFGLSSFNRATQAMRQPGSAFKPIVYATALENGYTPASVVVDGPISLPGANGTVWQPENYEHDYLGPLQLRKGLELSRNTMTVRLAMGVGMPRISKNAINLGVVKSMDNVLAMALGAGETTVFKLTAAYASFVNGGRKIEPHLIEEISDREGKIIRKADARDCDGCGAGFNGDESPRIAAPGSQFWDPITAYQITSDLQGVVQRGTAAAASVLGRPTGGKTGTTSEFRSAWFIGFTPHIVVGTYIGFDDNRSLGNGETGAQAAVPTFIDFMKAANQYFPPDDFKAPANAKYAMVRGIREAFKPGTEPRVADVEQAVGPQPYDQVFKNGVTGASSAAAAVNPPPTVVTPAKPPPKKDEAQGIY